LIFDIKRENFKITIFIKNPIHPPLGFCPNAKHFAARYQQYPIEKQLIYTVQAWFTWNSRYASPIYKINSGLSLRQQNSDTITSNIP